MVILQLIVPLSPILICGNAVERVSSFKYLGVWITKDLTWSRHVTEICAKARRVVGLIYRQYYQYSTSETLNQLVSFVRQHFEYAAPVRDPNLQKVILTNWRRYKSLHYECAQRTGWLTMMNCVLVVISPLCGIL